MNRHSTSIAKTMRAPYGRILLIAPHSSYRTAPFLAAAHALNVETLIASQGRHSIVSDYARGLHIDLRQPDEALEIILREAAKRPFTGVIGTDDATTELATRVAYRLDLPHNPLSAIRRARRKDLARMHLAHAGVPVPRHWRIDLRNALPPQAEAVRFPCVLKPVALSASRGVIRADNMDEFMRASTRIERILENEAEGEDRWLLLAEEFIPGAEVAVEGMMQRGELTVLAIFDKPDPLKGPYFEETYYVTPSHLSPAVQRKIHTRLAQACQAYELVEGPIHAECRVNEEGVWVLEIAARTIGGLCARLLRFGTGYGLEELVLTHAMGQALMPQPFEGAAGVLMIPTRQAGILRRVEGLMAAQRIPYIEEVHIAVREGYELVPLPEGSSYLGFIFARAPTADQAEDALRQAHACLNIVVAPLWKGMAAGCRLPKD